VLLGGGNKRRFDTLEDDLFVDIFVAMYRVDYTQDFIRIHRLSLSQVWFRQYSPTLLDQTKRPRRCKILRGLNLVGFSNLVSIPAK
jgi:hypothetical protein